MNTDTAVIRQFLFNYFNDEEFDALCFDYFPDVEKNFSDGLTKGKKIQLLLKHCEQQKQLAHLLEVLAHERPDLFKILEQEPQSLEPPSPSPSLLTLAELLAAIRLSPVKAMGLTLVGLLVVSFLLRRGFLPDDRDVITPTNAPIATSEAEDPTKTNKCLLNLTSEDAEQTQSTIAASDWQGPPSLVDPLLFCGPIGLNQTTEGTLSAGNFPHTWLFNEGPALIKITFEGEPHTIGLIRIHRESESDPANAATELNANGRGETIQLLLEAGSGHYIIAVRDAANEGGHYTLTIEGTAENESNNSLFQGSEARAFAPRIKTLILRRQPLHPTGDLLNRLSV